MTLLSFDALSVSFGAYEVLRSISGRVERGQRIGLVGENGAGKTTLLRTLLGKIVNVSGIVSIANEARVAYHGQEMDFSPVDTVLDWVMTGHGLCVDIALRKQAEHMLRDVGIYDGLFSRPLAHLSSGQRTRVALAQALVGSPDLLLLDEPTNFLDLDSMHWLAGFLRRYPGSALIVTHDRYFLDQVAQYIWELSRGRLTAYRGDYSAYRRQKAEREEADKRLRQQALTKRQQLLQVIVSMRERYAVAHSQASLAQDKGTVAFRKARAKKHARQIRARQKQLERLDSITPEQVHTPRTRQIVFTTTDVMSDSLVTLTDVSFNYRLDCPLLENINACIRPRERIGLLGSNGTGKTTLLRLIMNELRGSAGTIKRSHSLRLGYLPQDLRDVPQAVSAATWLAVRLRVNEQAARRLLGCMNVTKDEALRPLGHLSMGQRYRVLIAGMLAQDVGLLILDEPTNYLDLWGRESVEKALRSFGGALLLVSHDRYFLESLVDKLWVIENRKLVSFAGKISAYQDWRRLEINPERKARHLARARLKEQGLVLEMRLARLASILQDIPREDGSWEELDRQYTKVAEELNVIKTALQ